jgi:EF hand
MMIRFVTGTLVALALASGPAFAQATPPAASVADAGAEAKFKTADKDGSGTLEGAEVDAYKATLTKIDTNKDGKVSREEFAAATKAGHIK